MLRFNFRAMLEAGERARLQRICDRRWDIRQGGPQGMTFEESSRDPECMAITTEIDHLLAEVWKREARLERYSLISAKMDGRQCRVVIERFDAYLWERSFSWMFFGKRVTRQGVSPVAFTLVNKGDEPMMRRTLDGAWVPVIARGAS